MAEELVSEFCIGDFKLNLDLSNISEFNDSIVINLIREKLEYLILDKQPEYIEMSISLKS